MQVQAFRVSEVLRGHTAIAAVLGEDASGRMLRLEVPAAEAAAIGSGDVLVIGWARVEVPAARMAGATSTPSAAAMATTAATTSPIAVGPGRLDDVDGQAAIVDAVFTAGAAGSLYAGSASSSEPVVASRSPASPVGADVGAALGSIARSAESEFRRLFGVR